MQYIDLKEYGIPLNIPRRFQDYVSLVNWFSSIADECPINFIDDLDNFQKMLLHKCDRQYIKRLKNNGNLLNPTIPIISSFDFNLFKDPKELIENELKIKFKKILQAYFKNQLKQRKELEIDVSKPEYQVIFKKLFN